MSTLALPSNPSLEQLKQQAKDLCQGHRAGEPEVIARIKALHPQLTDASAEAITRASFRLSDAQLVIAREYQFESWNKLKAFVELNRSKTSTGAHAASAANANPQVDLAEAQRRGDYRTDCQSVLPRCEGRLSRNS